MFDWFKRKRKPLRTAPELIHKESGLSEHAHREVVAQAFARYPKIRPGAPSKVKTGVALEAIAKGQTVVIETTGDGVYHVHPYLKD